MRHTPGSGRVTAAAATGRKAPSASTGGPDFEKTLQQTQQIRNRKTTGQDSTADITHLSDYFERGGGTHNPKGEGTAQESTQEVSATGQAQK